MVPNLIIATLCLSVAIFLVPLKRKWILTFILQLLVAFTTGWISILALLSNGEIITIPFIFLAGEEVPLVIDSLSAYFVLIINFTALMGGLYSNGYLKPYYFTKTPTEFSLHYFNFFWLHVSMLLVCLIRNGLTFLMVWEIMAITSFFLVIFESEKRENIRIGINYLVQMHVALVFIMGGFIYASVKSNAEFGFNGLSVFFSEHSPIPLFVIFLIGFGIKAGFMPLHSWLPHAHPAAPSHVSAIMSGVMIKMGIYGLLRTILQIHSNLLQIGIILLVVSLFSGLLGVMYAIVQHDIKKLLAYHSIENIGIIGIGIGIGLIGSGLQISTLAALGFAGGILHVLNHSLFKSLLFYSAGSVYRQSHSRHVSHLGGLIKKMPWTAFLFLLGALAICGLPPFNGFISEFLIFSGLYNGIKSGGLALDLIIMATFVGLALIGGLAVFCFTKIFSIVFLGSPRTEEAQQAIEVGKNMLLPKLITGFAIVLIGMLPILVVPTLGNISSLFIENHFEIIQTTETLSSVSLASTLFVGFILVLWFIRWRQQKRVIVNYGPSWGCAYSGADPALHQYSATSFANNYAEIVRPLVNVKKEYHAFPTSEIFPGERKFQTFNRDSMEDYLVTWPINKLINSMERYAVFQTGKLQHYVLYALIFMILIFVLTVFQLI